MRNEIWAIILAAGRGTRLKQAADEPPKQFLPYRGAPLFWHSARNLSRAPRLDGLLFVFPPHSLAENAALADELAARFPLGLPYRCAAGGDERQDSVRNALAALPASCTHVLVHDAARPFVSPALAERLIAELEQGRRAVIPGLEPADTVKRVDEAGLVEDTPPRAALRTVQTPQAFEREALELAHAHGREQGRRVTDDAALLESAGVPVLVIPGEAANVKITRPEDLARLLDDAGQTKLLPCCGQGYDVHRYGGTRPLRLGGVLIKNTELTVAAHSDGDVLLHALMDALLGCASAGDIGEHFPDSDPRFEGINSAALLCEVLELVRGRGVVLTQVDLTIVAQTPKISPYRKEITRNIAHLLHLNERQVNLKASTEEGLGFTGAGEGIKALALVTALRPA